VGCRRSVDLTATYGPAKEDIMKQLILSLIFLAMVARPAAAQNPEMKFIADTLVVQAEGTYEADPDVATVTFDIAAQEKDLKQAYEHATQSMQKIVDLADHNKLKKEDVYSGVLTVQPYYEGDRQKRVRSYSVTGQIVLKVHDFSVIGPILDGSVEDGIADLRSLTYSLSDEEAAKQRAVAVAMQRAIGRATAALEQKGQKIGALRYASLDVKQLLGVVESEGTVVSANEVMDLPLGVFSGHKAAAPPPPLPHVSPGKITVSATVQCAFQIL
jgi:hypothetical protein